MDKQKALESLKLAQESMNNVYDILGGCINKELQEELSEIETRLDNLKYLIKNYQYEPYIPDKQEWNWELADRQNDERKLNND